MMTYEIKDISQIGTILDLVHDRYFDLDKIVFEKEKKSLKIPITVLGEEIEIGRFLCLKRWKRLIYRSELIIDNVETYDVVDNAQIGCADVNTIYVRDNLLIIKCGLPVMMKIRISSLHILLIVTDSITREETYYFRLRDYISFGRDE